MAAPCVGSDEESDEESSDESDFSESEEESDMEEGAYDLDICPAGCDQALYDGTCALREKRLDIEESLTEEKKVGWMDVEGWCGVVWGAGQV